MEHYSGCFLDVTRQTVCENGTYVIVYLDFTDHMKKWNLIIQSCWFLDITDRMSEWT